MDVQTTPGPAALPVRLDRAASLALPAQLAAEVRRLVGAGTLPRGARLPASRALAAELAGSLRDVDGCTELTDAPSYGARSVSVTCETARGTRVVRAGVLGDAWLGCSLDGGRGVAAAEVERRSDLWCAGLLQALDGTSVPSE